MAELMVYWRVDLWAEGKAVWMELMSAVKMVEN